MDDTCLLEEEGLKFDADKPPLDLLTILPMEAWAALSEVGQVLVHGRDKYSIDNWTLGMDWRRLIGASMRHIFAWARGEDKDDETQASHLAHAICGLLFLLTYEREGWGHDNRFKAE